MQKECIREEETWTKIWLFSESEKSVIKGDKITEIPIKKLWKCGSFELPSQHEYFHRRSGGKVEIQAENLSQNPFYLKTILIIQYVSLFGISQYQLLDLSWKEQQLIYNYNLPSSWNLEKGPSLHSLALKKTSKNNTSLSRNYPKSTKPSKSPLKKPPSQKGHPKSKDSSIARNWSLALCLLLKEARGSSPVRAQTKWLHLHMIQSGLHFQNRQKKKIKMKAHQTPKIQHFPKRKFDATSMISSLTRKSGKLSFLDKSKKTLRKKKKGKYLGITTPKKMKMTQ